MTMILVSKEPFKHQDSALMRTYSPIYPRLYSAGVLVPSLLQTNHSYHHMIHVCIRCVCCGYVLHFVLLVCFLFVTTIC